MTSQPQGSPTPQVEVRHRIQIAREWAGLEQDQLAERAEISRNTISNYETGATTHMKPLYLKQIALATGVPLEWILTGETTPAPGDGDGCTARDSNPEPADLRSAVVVELAPRRRSGTLPFVVEAASDRWTA